MSNIILFLKKQLVPTRTNYSSVMSDRFRRSTLSRKAPGILCEFPNGQRNPEKLERCQTQLLKIHRTQNALCRARVPVFHRVPTIYFFEKPY